MGFTTDETMVRVDFFKESGKWYTTEAVRWTGDYDGDLIHEAFAQSLRDHFADDPARLSGMDAVCLAPHHKHAHPIMLKQGEWMTRGRYRICKYQDPCGACTHKDAPKDIVTKDSMPCNQQNCPWRKRQYDNKWWENHPGRFDDQPNHLR